MSAEQNLTEIIDRYLQGRMSASELEEFEHNLAIDEELRLEVEAQKAVIQLIHEDGQEEKMRQLFKGFQEKLQAEESPIIKPLREDPTKEIFQTSRTQRYTRYFAIAASVTFIAFIGFLLWRNGNLTEDLPQKITQAEKSISIPIYLSDSSSFGFAGSSQVLEEINIQLLVDSVNAPSYRFFNGVDLQILSPDTTLWASDIFLSRDGDNVYTLVIDSLPYPIQYGSRTLSPLVAE